MTLNDPAKYEREIEEDNQINSAKARAGAGSIQYDHIMKDCELLAERAGFVVTEGILYQKQGNYYEKVDNEAITLEAHNIFGAFAALPSKIRQEFHQGVRIAGKKRYEQMINLDEDKDTIISGSKVFFLKNKYSRELTDKDYCMIALPWEVSENKDTPNIDKILSSWGNAKRLKDLIAYSLLKYNQLNLTIN
jgi:hypothetical protein